MSRRRGSVARLMAVVAVLAVGLGFLRTAPFPVNVAVAPPITLGLVGVILLGGRARRFAVGWAAGGLLMAGLVLGSPPLVTRYRDFVADLVPRWAPDVTTTTAVITVPGRIAPAVTSSVTIEFGPVASAVSLALWVFPSACGSLIGGSLVLAFRPRARPNPAPTEPDS